MLQQLLFVLVKAHFIGKALLAFNELCGAETGGNAQAVGVVFNDMYHRVDTAVHRRVAGAEVVDLRLHLLPRRLHGLVNELRHALTLGGRDRHNGDAQHIRELFHIDRAAVGMNLVHHIQRQHHGHAQFQQLQR